MGFRGFRDGDGRYDGRQPLPDIIYSGSALADSTTYYWRITFWDDDGEEGAVSATQEFTTGTISPTAIYYSVGTSTDDLKSGTPTMTIARHSKAATPRPARAKIHKGVLVGSFDSVGGCSCIRTTLNGYYDNRLVPIVRGRSVTGGTSED